MVKFKVETPITKALDGLQWAGQFEVDAEWEGKPVTLHLNYDGLMVMQTIGLGRMMEVVGQDAKRFLMEDRKK